MPLGEPHKPVEHKLTADELALLPRTAPLPGSRLDMSAHPTDFKAWDEGKHPRDAAGRFGNNPGVRVASEPSAAEQNEKNALNASVYYHGTSTAVWSSIIRYGLEAGAGKVKHGADEWAKKNGLYADTWRTKDRILSVFLTNEIDVAIAYAERAAEITGTKPVILKIDRAGMQRDKIKIDEQSGSAIRYKGSIPPKYISTMRNVVKGREIKPLYVFYLVKK